MNNFCWLLLLMAGSCSGQPVTSPVDRTVGGPCEGCEALYEYGDQELSSTATLTDEGSTDQKLKISGTVYGADGRTPAANVILYVYQADATGRYVSSDDAVGWGRRHGAIRGWLKTDQGGRYGISTIRPGAYPGRLEPAHIHLTVQPPGFSPYYLDDFFFADDPLLSEEYRSRLEDRGGNGILYPEKSASGWIANRDIFIARNVPGF